MTDFGFLSDTDDSAVEDLISQAKDLSVLEQVSKINCSGFTDSVLPAELESRFHKLKSLPPSISRSFSKSSTKTSHKSLYHSKSDLGNRVKGKTEFGSQTEEENEVFSDSKQTPDRKMDLTEKSQSGYVSSPVGSSNSSSGNDSFGSWKKNPSEKKSFKEKSKLESPLDSSGSLTENEIFSASKRKPTEKRKLKLKLKSKSGSLSSPLGSSDSWMDLPSPPRKTGCFCFSPKLGSRKKSKGKRVMSKSHEWTTNDEFLSDLSVFSVKEQQKILKRAMKEEEKLSREADKIVKWAKQASARMSAHGLEDELSDEGSKS